MRVLVIDDDCELRELLTRALDRDGHRTRGAGSLAEAWQELAAHTPELLVLDLDLPDGNGLELCRALRSDGVHVPVLVLTAAGEVGARVSGLDAGADDYLVKPFALAELRARVRALGRRRQRADVALRHEHGGVVLDFAARRAWRQGLEVELTPREWALLESLGLRRGRVVARDVLLEEAWGEVNESAAGSLEVLIARVRRKLGRDVVRTVRGEGYAIAT